MYSAYVIGSRAVALMKSAGSSLRSTQRSCKSMVAGEVSGPLGLMACISFETTLQPLLLFSLRCLDLEGLAYHHGRPGDACHLVGERDRD